MKIPLVSICIPAYRADKYLEVTLRSIAAQEFTDWEVVVTEDGSKDRAEEIVREFAKTVSQPVTYERHPENRGLPATRNTGILSARGTWVAFLDSDDLWKPQHLAALVAARHDPQVDLIFGGSILFDDATGIEGEIREPRPGDLANLPVVLYTGELSILPSSIMVRRSAFERFGMISTDFPHVNDTEYWLRILSKGGQIRYSGLNSCLYRQHPNAMSKKSAEMLIDSARLCEKYAKWDAIPRGLRRSRPASLYRWAGRTLLADNPAEARKVLAHALRLEPLNAKTLGLWTKALLKKA